MFKDLAQNIEYLKSLTDKSADFTVRKMVLREGTSVAIITIEGMVNKDGLALSVTNPLVSIEIPKGVNKYEFIRDRVLTSSEMVEIDTFNQLIEFSMSGFAVVAVDGYSKMLVVGIQGFSFRSVSEPSSEMVFRGSREGFTEPLRINMTLIRRRIKSPDLVFKTMTVGDISKTQICLCYLNSAVSKRILDELVRRLKSINLDTVLASGYLVSYLGDNNHNTLISTVGVTERPDTLCGKITEGRIGVLVDGTPSAIIVPHLFIENFQSFDDYSNRPYFSSFIRILKYISFLFALYLPGLFVAITNFQPEYIPRGLLNHIVSSLETTPFPLMLEVLLVTFMYEVMREAGLRLPKPLGHAVGIVGALVIGETGVSAGLICATTLIIVAFSAICSYVVPDLYGAITVMKFIFIIVGGMFGFLGIVLASLVAVVSISSLSSFGVPFLSPIAPVSTGILKDNFIRADWHRLSKHKIKVQNMKGADDDFKQ
ncbi:MAG: spore germination protein [Ruminococcus sp.]